MSKLGDAFATAVREVGAGLPGKGDLFRTYLAFFLPAACLIGGLMFAAQGLGGAGFILNALSGAVASLIYVVMLLGGLYAFGVTMSLFHHLRHDSRARRPGTFDLIDKLQIAASGLIIALCLSGILAAVSYVPVLGKQVSFMFRDRD